jgi:hypothetical protein
VHRCSRALLTAVDIRPLTRVRPPVRRTAGPRPPARSRTATTPVPPPSVPVGRGMPLVIVGSILSQMVNPSVSEMASMESCRIRSPGRSRMPIMSKAYPNTKSQRRPNSS